MTGVKAAADAAPTEEKRERALYARIGWRIFPILVLGYICAYLDRINIGFAALQMKADLGFTDTIYGLGAGIFFAGYLACEVPSNLLLQRVGARLTLSRIMVCWGMTSCCMMFVRTPSMFYILRVLLGVFEAGFTPGVVFYLTLWYPKARLARVTAIFLSGSVMAGLLGSPVSGVVLDVMTGFHGLRGWQWLFLLEGLPSVLLGVASLFLLADGPQSARWLSENERRQVLAGMPAARERNHGGFAAALRDSNVYAIAFAWFTVICGTYAVSFWMPMMLRSAGVHSASSIGLWSIIPYGVGAAGMLLLSRHSDRTLERRWHAASCALAGAAALALLPSAVSSLPLTLVALTVTTVSVFAAMPILFSIPMTVLSPRAAPGGIALINSIGQTGGFLSPFLLGWVKTTTGSLNIGLYIIATLLGLGAIVMIRVIRTSSKPVRRVEEDALPVAQRSPDL